LRGRADGRFVQRGRARHRFEVRGEREHLGAGYGVIAVLVRKDLIDKGRVKSFKDSRV